MGEAEKQLSETKKGMTLEEFMIMVASQTQVGDDEDNITSCIPNELLRGRSRSASRERADTKKLPGGATGVLKAGGKDRKHHNAESKGSRCEV